MIIAFPSPSANGKEQNPAYDLLQIPSFFFFHFGLCPMPKTCAIVPAAGRGLRMGKDRPKQFLELSGKPILSYTLDTLSRASFISHIFLVVPEDFFAQTEELVKSLERSGAEPLITVVVGGAQRQDSVFNGLEHLPPDCEWVLIHDGVRPFASLKLVEDTWQAALKTGASIAAVSATDTIKRVEGELVLETLPREEIWLVQTPQVFRKDLILEAYREAQSHGWLGTDDASLVERTGAPVSVVQGERTNVKVTTPEDLVWAAWFLSGKGDRGLVCSPQRRRGRKENAEDI